MRKKYKEIKKFLFYSFISFFFKKIKEIKKYNKNKYLLITLLIINV